MEGKGWIFLNALINRYHEGPKDTLLRFLPQEDAESIFQNPTTAHDVLFAVATPYDRLKKIHYSWFTEPLKHLSPDLQKLIIASLPETQRKGLCQLFNITDPLPAVSLPVQAFLLSLFYDMVLKRDLIPLPLLPQKKLSFLMNFDKQQLLDVIDLLGLYDLAHSVRKIVDKSQLQKVFSSLSLKQQQFLKMCLHQSDCLPPGPFLLDHWDEQTKSLQHLVHRRGLQRLAKALTGYHPSFLDAIVKVLDTGRGQLISQNHEKETPQNVAGALEMQVISVVKFLSTT